MTGWPLARVDAIPMRVHIDLLAEILGCSRRTIERRIDARRFPIPRLAGETVWFSGFEVKRHLLQSVKSSSLRLVG